MRSTPARKRAQRAANLVLSGALVLVWFQVLRPEYLGGPAGYTIIEGTSMRPGFHDGDFALTHTADTYRVGDVIAYRVPDGSPMVGLGVIHRIVGGNGETGYVTQGDNRSTPDPWRPRDRDVLGRIALRVPYVGRVVEFLRTGPMLAWLLGSCALGALWSVERRRRPVLAPTRP